MLSNRTKNIYKLSRSIKKPFLFTIRQQGGLTRTYEKLDTHWVKFLEIDTVLDTSTNTVQFTETILALLPNANIYSSEPLPDCFEQLQEFANSRKNITLFNLEIGNQAGLIYFERNAASPSSSFLK